MTVKLWGVDRHLHFDYHSESNSYSFCSKCCLFLDFFIIKLTTFKCLKKEFFLLMFCMFRYS